MLHRDEQTIGTCWFAVNNATPHLNVSGPNNAKADYANWGYWGRCNVTMAPSWLGCECVHYSSPWVSFFFPPQMPFPEPATPHTMVSSVRPHYKGCCQWEGQGSSQRIRLINNPPGLINQLVFSLPPIGNQLTSKQRSERKKMSERISRTKEKGECKQAWFAGQIPETPLFPFSLEWHCGGLGHWWVACVIMMHL